MTFTYKLARRLALSHAPMLPLALAVLAAACAGDESSSLGPDQPGDAAGAVVLVPRTATVEVHQPVRFQAHSAEGDTLAASDVEWSASGGSVNADGVFAADEPGTYQLVARGRKRRQKPDTSTVIVTPKVTAIVVTPETAALAPGGSQQFSATAKLSDGTSQPATVVWSATGGTVDAGGRYVAGSTAGTWQVVAVQSGGTLADTASVTITTDPGDGPLAGECATPRAGWIWCDDFEQDRLSSYFEYQSDGGRFVRASGVGNEGSWGMRGRFQAGTASAGALHLAVGRTPQAYFRPVDGGSANYRELYWRMYVRTQPGWTGGAGYKLSRAFVFASEDSWAQAMIAHVWGGSKPETRDYLALDPASGTDEAGNLVTTTYNDFDNLRWLGAARATTPIFDAAHVGQWYCVEAHARLNDPGQSNGLFELWIDDRPEASRTGLNFLGAFDAYGLNAVYFENYWNGGAPVSQERYFDNIVVSTQRIGC